MLIRKTIAALAAMLAVEKVLAAVGVSGIYRFTGLEQFVREMYGEQFHPLQAKCQYCVSGRMAVG